MSRSDSLPKGCVGRCGDCGMPLRAWDERHTIADCDWWKATQPLRDALVGLGRMQEEIGLLQSREGGSE
jgi:hypothetical protein